MVSRDGARFPKMTFPTLSLRNRKARGGSDKESLKITRDTPSPLPSPRSFQQLQSSITQMRMKRRMSDTPTTSRNLLKRLSCSSLRNLNNENASTELLQLRNVPLAARSTDQLLMQSYEHVEWPCFAPPLTELSASYLTPEDMWIHRKTKDTTKPLQPTVRIDEVSQEDHETCSEHEPSSPVLSLSSTEWSGHSHNDIEAMTALSPQPIIEAVAPIERRDFRYSSAFTFFVSDNDSDDDDDDDEEEEEEEEEDVEPSTPVPSEEDDFSASETSTLRSEHSDRVGSSSSSVSGKTSRDKAARVLGLDRNSISSAGSFAASTLIGDADGAWDPFSISSDELSSMDATIKDSLYTNGWSNYMVHKNDDNDESAVTSTATLDAAWLWKALRGNKKPDTTLLNAVLVGISQDPERMVQMRQRYKELYVEDLISEIKAKTQGQYRAALCSLIQGPYETSTRWFDHSDSNFVLDDKLVVEALFAKEPDEIKLIMLHFQQTHGYSLKSAIEALYIKTAFRSTFGSDMAAPTECFGLACLRTLAADRDVERIETLDLLTPDQLRVRETRLSFHVSSLYRVEAGKKRKVLDHRLLLELVMTKSPLYLAELCRRFSEHHGVQLTELVSAKGRSKNVSAEGYPGSLAYGIIYTLNGATSRPQRDAQILEESAVKTRSINSSPERLITRCIRIYYDDSSHLDYVKEVYQQRYRRSLVDRIASSTKGPCRDLLVRIMDGRRDQRLPGR